jgi:hypothetical protein
VTVKQTFFLFYLKYLGIPVRANQPDTLPSKQNQLHSKREAGFIIQKRNHLRLPAFISVPKNLCALRVTCPDALTGFVVKKES